LHSGHESELDLSLNFFDKDPITWKEHKDGVIFEKIFELKHRNQALWNDDWCRKMVRIKTTKCQILFHSREPKANTT
jgi:cyclomaltodextrinase